MSVYEIPDGLNDLLQDFTVQVLRKKIKKPDLVRFACEYFNKELKNDKNRGGAGAGGNYNTSFGSTRTRSDREMSADDDENSSNRSNEELDDDDDDFVPILSSSHALRRKSIAGERYDPEHDTDDELIIHPKTDSQRRRLKVTLQKCLYFRHLTAEQTEQLIDALFEKNVDTADEMIIKENDDGDYMYVVEEGVFEAFRLVVESIAENVAESSTNLEKFEGFEPRKIYDNCGYFGELALMYNTPRACCVISKTPGRLWAMDRATFRKIVIRSNYLKLKQYVELLSKCSLFLELTQYERNNVAYALKSVEYLDGQVIIKQYDEADSMYFVESGSVKCLVKQQDQGEQREVSRVEPGGYFGELALLTDQPRAATVIALGETKVARLDREDFQRLLGSVKSIMKRNIPRYEEQLIKVFGSKNNITNLL